MSIEVGRTIGPPGWASLAQRMFGGIDRGTRRRFSRLIAISPRDADGASCGHQIPDQRYTARLGQ